MLSLPDNWEFSGRGLAAILPDGKDKVFSSLRRLEEHGYLQRNKITLKGKVVDYEYEFCDSPIFPKKVPKPSDEKAKAKKKKNSKKHTEKPCPENPDTAIADENKYTNQSDACFKSKKKVADSTGQTTAIEKKSEEKTSSLLSSEMTYIPAPTSSDIAAIKDKDTMCDFVKTRLIMYTYCIEKLLLPENDVDVIVNILVDMLMHGKKQWIGGRYVGIRQIRSRLCRLDAERVAIILTNISKTKGIKNYKQYLMAALLNLSDISPSQ